MRAYGPFSHPTVLRSCGPETSWRAETANWSSISAVRGYGIGTGVIIDLDADGLGEIVADFGTLGVWQYDEPGGWSSISPDDPAEISRSF
jgi:hypothetical protein